MLPLVCDFPPLVTRAALGPNVSHGALSDVLRCIRDDVDALTSRHQAELRSYLEGWSAHDQRAAAKAGMGGVKFPSGGSSGADGGVGSEEGNVEQAGREGCRKTNAPEGGASYGLVQVTSGASVERQSPQLLRQQELVCSSGAKNDSQSLPPLREGFGKHDEFAQVLDVGASSSLREASGASLLTVWEAPPAPPSTKDIGAAVEAAVDTDAVAELPGQVQELVGVEGLDLARRSSCPPRIDEGPLGRFESAANGNESLERTPALPLSVLGTGTVQRVEARRISRRRWTNTSASGNSPECESGGDNGPTSAGTSCINFTALETEERPTTAEATPPPQPPPLAAPADDQQVVVVAHASQPGASTGVVDRIMKKARHGLHLQGTRSKTQKFKNDGMHADDYLTTAARQAAEAHETRLERITTSREFEWVIMTVIVLNTLFIGAQVEYVTALAEEEVRDHGRAPRDERPAFVIVAHLLFVIIFSVELVLRWATDGFFGFFHTQEWAWNTFDTLLVISSTVDLIVEQASGFDGMAAHIACARVLRVFRVVRILRIIRVVNFFRDLRIMLQAIIGSIKTLLWVMIILTLIFYIFGIMLTWGVYDFHMTSGSAWLDPKYDDLRVYFGTLFRSIISLYMGITNGKSWDLYYDALADLSLYRVLFLMFIAFSLFAAVNVVTGVFVESAMRTSEEDRDFLIQEELQAREANLKSLHRLFLEMDTSANGTISLQEFERHVTDERAMAYFQSMKLDVTEVKTLFELLDIDRSGQIDIKEFMVGCDKLRGEAKSLDVAVLQFQVRWLIHMFCDFSEFMEDHLGCISGRRTRSGTMRSAMETSELVA